jgi:hypothetical protein
VRAVLDNRLASPAVRTRDVECFYDLKVRALHLVPFNVQGTKYQQSIVLAVAKKPNKDKKGTGGKGGTRTTHTTRTTDSTDSTDSTGTEGFASALAVFSYGVASNDAYLQTLSTFLGPSPQSLEHSFSLNRRYPVYKYLPMELEVFTVSVPRTDYLLAFANVFQRLALSAGAFTVDLADPHGTLLSLDLIAGCREPIAGALESCRVGTLAQAIQQQARNGSLTLSLEASDGEPNVVQSMVGTQERSAVLAYSDVGSGGRGVGRALTASSGLKLPPQRHHVRG